MPLLPPVSLPQSANNDEFICHTDVELFQGVIVRIYQYDLAAPGDLIKLFWNDVLSAEFLIGETIPSFWDTTIHVSDVHSDLNTVYYTVVDAAQNFNYSEMAKVFILQNCEATLPPPLFSDAENGVITENSIIAQQGTHVSVRPYRTFIAGDIITVFFDGYTPDDTLVPAAHYQVAHTLNSTDILNGFSVLVPTANLFAIGNGQAQARYTRQPAASADIEYSDTAFATVIAASVRLPAPVYDDAENGWLDAAAVSGGIAVSVRLALDIDIEPGDTVTLSWSGYDFYGQLIAGTPGSSVHAPVSAADIAAGVLRFTIPDTIVAFVQIMTLRCEYTVVNSASGRFRYSESATALVDVMGRTVPAPVFPYALNGILTQESITDNNGTLLRASYLNMAVGDTLYFTVSGTDAAGNPVAAAGYSATVTVNSTQANTSIVDIPVPAANLLAVGNNGLLTGNYRVLFNSSPGGFASSGNAVAILQEHTTWILTEQVLENNAEANGSARNVILYTLKDSLNNPVPGVYLQFTVDRQGVTLDNTFAHTTESGQFILGITGSSIGPVTVRAAVVSDTSIFAESSLMFTGIDVELIAQTLTDYAPANGSAFNRVLFTLREKQTHTRIPNVFLHIESSNGATPSSVVQKTDSNGYVELMITNTIPGNVWIEAESEASPVRPAASTTEVVTFT